MNRFFSFAALQITLVAALLPSAAFSFDVVKTWTGGGNANFYNPPNWSGGTRPDSLPGTNTDSLLFDGTGIIPNPVVLNVNGTQTAYELKSWTFTAGDYTFGGANSIQNITLGDTTSAITNTGILQNSGTGTVTFNNTSAFSLRFGAIDAAAGPIIFGTNPTLNIGFNLNNAVNNVTAKGAADINVGSVIAGAGTDTSAGGVLIKEGTNTLFLNNNSAGWNGRIAINNGQVNISKPNALGSPAGRTTIGGDASTGRLQISGSIGITEPLYLGGRASANTSDHVRNISGTNLLAGPITLDAGGTEYYLRSDTGTLAASGDVAYGSATGSSTLHLQGDGNGSLTGNVGTGGVDLGILKEGAGTWTLSGPNAYAGATTILAGHLNITTAQTGKGATFLADGTTLGLTLAAAGQSFAPTALALGTVTGGTLDLDLGSFGANPIVPVINTGAVTVTGTNTINIKAGGLSIGQFPLIRYTSLGGAGAAGLALGSLPARVNANLVDDAAHSQVLLNVVLFDYPRWTGAQDGNWDIDDGTATGTANWKEFNSGVVTRYLQSATSADGVRFDDTAVGTSNVILTGTLTPASVKVVNEVLAYTFSGVGKLSGNGSLTKEGPGTLVLVNTGINDYAGTTTITAGTVQVGDGFQASGGSLGTGPVINNASLVLNRPDNYTLAGAISGTGSIVQKGPGVTTLSGTNTFSGPVTVAAGTLRLGNGNALGSTAAGTAVAAGGVIDLNGQLLPQGEVVSIVGDGIGGAGALINTGTGGSGVGLKNLVLTGPATIGGSTRWDIRDSDGGVNANGFDLIKTGTNPVYWANLGETGIGNLNINGSASRLVFEGNTTLGGQPGIVTVETSAQLGLENNTAVNTKPIHLNTGTIRVTAGTTNAIASPITIDTVGTLDVGAATTELLLSGRLTGNGNLIKTSAGIVKMVGDNNDFAGVTQISAGALWLGNDGGTGSLPATDIVDNATLTIRRTDTALNITSNISGTGAVIVGLATAGSSSSLVTLSGNNSFTGAVTVNRGGLRITNSNALGAGPKVVAVQSNQKPHLHLAAAGDDIVLDPSISFNTSSDDATLPGIINEAGNNIIGGTINLRNGSGGNTRIRVDAGSLALAGQIIAAPDATSARTLILDGVGTENRIDGVLANGVGNPNATPVVAPQNLLLTKTGIGTWTLNAANTFTGATAIQQGVLKLGPAGSIASTASIDVAAGATLDASAAGLPLAGQTVTGSGTIQGTTTLGTASIFSPGTSTTTGTLSVAGSLVFGGGTLQTNVSLPLLTSATTGDLVNVTGDVTITAASKIQVLPTGAVLAGTYPLVTYTGTLNGDPATLSITNTTRAAVAVDTATPGQINLVFSGGNASLVWSGNGTSSVWDSSTKANWNTGVERFFQVDAVRFDDTAPADKTAITVTGTLYPALVTVDSAQNFSFSGSGVIAGTGGLVKSGTGILTINNTGSYSGKTLISGSTLLLGATGKLTNTRWIQVDLGAAFDVSAITAGFTLGSIADQRVLSGQGTVIGTLLVNGAGVIKPGASSDGSDITKAGDGVGQITFTTDLTLAGAAVAGAPRAVLQLAGATGRVSDPNDTAAISAFDRTVPTNHDYVAVTGALHLDAGSTIKVVLDPAYTPEYGDVYNLIDWGTVDLNADATGAGFDAVADLDLPALPEGLGWNRSYFATQGLLVVGVSAPEVSAISFSPSATVNPGSVITLSVTVVSPAEVTYQWKRNNIAIQDATNASLVLTAAESDEASYTVTVSNVAGSTTSPAATLTVNDPVTISSPPQPWTGNPGDTASFSVSVTGMGPFTYQWRKNEVAINDATSATLSLPGVTEGSEGSYDVVVTNIVGSQTSVPSVLSVNNPVAITTDPLGRVVIPGGSVTFNVGVSGTGPFTYQWRKDTHPIQGAIGVSYTTPPIATGDQGIYDVVVTNSVNSATSQGAFLEVISGAVPRIIVQPVSKLVAQGSPVTLEVTAVAAPTAKYQWLKNNAVVAGATSRVLSFASAQLANAGAYSVRITGTSATLSNIVQLGVVDTSTKASTLAAGAAATLTVPAAGNGLSFVWKKDEGDLPVETRITQSVDKKTVTIKLLKPEDAATYRATVTGPGGIITGGKNDLKIFTDAPIILTPVEFPAAVVSGKFEFQIPVDETTTKAPTAYAVSGLPKGLAVDVKSGLISGKPLVASTTKPFNVVLTASNTKGKSSVTVQLTVAPLPTGTAGTFTGPIGRDEVLNAGLGGRLELSTLATGIFSGKLVLGATPLSFTGVLDASTTGENPRAKVVVARKGAASLTFDFAIDALNNKLTGASITDGVVVLNFDGWRNSWVAKTHVPLFAGYYTLGLEIPESAQSVLTVPQGQGFGSFTVAPAGTLVLAGKLSDGTVITNSTFAGPNGELAVFQPLYVNKGSIAGSLSITTGTPAAAYGDSSLSGTVSWRRPAIAGRTYAAALGTLNLSTVGGRYVPPAAPKLFLGLTDGEANARVVFSDARISTTATPPGLTLSIRTGNKLTLPKINPAKTSLTIAPSTGAFNGLFTLNDPNPALPKSPFVRTNIAYQGLVIRNAEGLTGFGFFLLQQLPTALPPQTPPLTLSTTPILSGQVVLEAASGL